MNKVKIWILNHRIIFLIITVAGLAVATYYIATCCGLANEILKISIALFALSLSTLLVLSMYKIYDIQKQLDKRFINWFLDNRKCSLLGAGFLGSVLAVAAYYIATCFCLDNDILKSSITILALGLPTFFILWLFRTHDVQEQLKKTEENTNNSTFFECARMLTAEDSLSKKIALEQLAYLKRETSFDKKKIDLLTRNLSLNDTKLNYAQLSGINLSGAELTDTSLIHVDLRNADLRDTDLINADLRSADLRNADLRGADFRGAILRGADFMGANQDNSSMDQATKDNATLDDFKKAKLDKIHSAGLLPKEADLKRTELKEANMKGAIYNDMTEFEGTWLNDEGKREEAKMIDVSEKLDK